MDSAAGDAAFDRMDSKRRREVAFIEVQDRHVLGLGRASCRVFIKLTHFRACPQYQAKLHISTDELQRLAEAFVEQVSSRESALAPTLLSTLSSGLLATQQRKLGSICMHLHAVQATAAPLTCSPPHAQLELGLREKQRSSLLMLPTMVDVLPQGQETGEYYSIDFGGTNLRLLYTRLGAAKHAVVTPLLQRARRTLRCCRSTHTSSFCGSWLCRSVESLHCLAGPAPNSAKCCTTAERHT